MDLWAILLIGSIVPLYLWISINEHESFLESRCVDFPDGSFRRNVPLVDQLRSGIGSYLFEGKHPDRTFTVEYRYRWGSLFIARFRWPATMEDLVIRVPMLQKFWLRMLREKRTSLTEGIRVNSAIDSEFVIHSNQPEAACEFLNYFYVQKELNEVCFDRLEIYRGSFELMFHHPARRSFSAGDLKNAIAALIRLASHYEAMSRLQMAVSAGQEPTLCPYCRGTMEGSPGVVVQCRFCGTRLHESCWNDNGQCTTWGCSSANANHTL